MRSTEIVTAFWEEVWNADEADAVDRFVADDVVIEAGGQKIAGQDSVKNWIKQFLDHVNDLHVDTIETFQSDDGTRVTSRWVMTGTNNGILGTEPNGKPIAMTGTAIWTVDKGKLHRGWIEQASFELYHWLLAK
ncbi:SnoaL-like polyketide cyclase [Mycobacterium sp. JS623]|uniref:ester cyclase n=1 Tax=Mycobacterium sp. JS623 TaxID=212767 RepID=UPI0002A5910E|nr:ester cyclase [Mycobacterium sp. JS623]AGB25762.1 SnoaL-like polyketide cyclase [Mycobacterium sp. JS623]